MIHKFALEVKYGGDDRSWYFYTDDIDEACQALSSRSVDWYELWDLAEDEWTEWVSDEGESFNDYHSKHQLDDMIAGILFEDDDIFVGADEPWESLYFVRVPVSELDALKPGEVLDIRKERNDG